MRDHQRSRTLTNTHTHTSHSGQLCVYLFWVTAWVTSCEAPRCRAETTHCNERGADSAAPGGMVVSRAWKNRRRGGAAPGGASTPGRRRQRKRRGVAETRTQTGHGGQSRTRGSGALRVKCYRRQRQVMYKFTSKRLNVSSSC